eukprot:s2269_g1.t1
MADPEFLQMARAFGEMVPHDERWFWDQIVRHHETGRYSQELVLQSMQALRQRVSQPSAALGAQQPELIAAAGAPGAAAPVPRAAVVRRRAPTVPNQNCFTIEGRLLTRLFIVYRRALGVDDAQDEDRCLACSRTENHWATPFGEELYRETGICEVCINVMHDRRTHPAFKRAHGVALTNAGIHIAKTFVGFHRAKTRLVFWREWEFHEAQNIAMEHQALPVARR